MQILDNIVIAHEYVHYLNNLRRGKNHLVALKIDMAKAYDRTEWRFLANGMIRMGFDFQFVM